jgi:glycerol-3-phosphate acyltransferase PlsY
MVSLFLILVLSYLLGAFPTAIIAGRILMGDDIRRHGSKNAGATNVFRVLGWKPALFVLIVDVGKGLFASLVISQITLDPVPLEGMLVRILASVFAVVGHIWPVYVGFRGGKGVGTAFGALLGLAPWAMVVSGIIWILLVVIVRIVSVGSLGASVVFPVTLYVQKHCFGMDVSNTLQYFSIGFAVLIIVTHRSNIIRLLKGEERRFGSSKRRPEESK